MDQSKTKNSYLIGEDKTQYHADSVEWCPFSHLSHFFVCGTYQLDEVCAKIFTYIYYIEFNCKNNLLIF